MKILFNQNLSSTLVHHLQDLYPGSTHVKALKFQESEDEQIWDYAKQNDYVIATKDGDYEILSHQYGHPPKVILVQTGNGPSKNLLKLLRALHTELLQFANDDSVSIFYMS